MHSNRTSNYTAIALACCMVFSGAASAHVALADKTAQAGATITAQFHVGHGCDGSPTKALRIAMPDAIANFTPQSGPGWTAAREGRDAVWRGGPLDPKQAGKFEVRLTLPQTAGPLVFPATQTCETGTALWNEVAGKDAAPITHPAPVLMVLAQGAPAPVAEAATGLVVSEAWIRLLPGQLPAGGYFTLRNTTRATVTLTGVASKSCGMLMLHRTSNRGGMASMVAVPELDVPAGGAVRFTPGSYHLMCMSPDMRVGGTAAVTLTFKDGKTLDAVFAIRNAAGK